MAQVDCSALLRWIPPIVWVPRKKHTLTYVVATACGAACVYLKGTRSYPTSKPRPYVDLTELGGSLRFLPPSAGLSGLREPSLRWPRDLCRGQRLPAPAQPGRPRPAEVRHAPDRQRVAQRDAGEADRNRAKSNPRLVAQWQGRPTSYMSSHAFVRVFF